MRVIKRRGVEVLKQHSIINWLDGLCMREPLSTHCYAVYYLSYEPDRTEVLLLTSNNSIRAYAVIRYGGRFTIEDVYEVYFWNPTREIVEETIIPPDKRVDVLLQDSISSSDIEIIIDHFRDLGFSKFHVKEFHDMTCTSDSFKPSPLENLAVKLGEAHAQVYRDLELERGVELGIEEAREILRTYTHYGVIVGGVLASIATRYITLPYLHIIGGVFTRKKYRGRGYAKAVVSALTREAISIKALAGLHVEVGNKPAIRVYENLGYKVAKTKTWVFVHP